LDSEKKCSCPTNAYYITQKDGERGCMCDDNYEFEVDSIYNCIS